MKIAVAFDHAGLSFRQPVLDGLREIGHQALEFTSSSDAGDDYPDFAAPAARAILRGECQRGIFVCGSGIGMSIVANKFPGIRAAVCHDEYTARISRAHNDANVLCLGSRVLDKQIVAELVRLWLSTDFEGGRHSRRLKKIEALEKEVASGLNPPS